MFEFGQAGDAVGLAVGLTVGLAVGLRVGKVVGDGVVGEWVVLSTMSGE